MSLPDGSYRPPGRKQTRRRSPRFAFQSVLKLEFSRRSASQRVVMIRRMSDGRKKKESRRRRRPGRPHLRTVDLYGFPDVKRQVLAGDKKSAMPKHSRNITGLD